MGKGISIGVSDKARKGKKAWIGIDGVARKIKKMWIGVGNVARLFFSGRGVLVYHGKLDDLSVARQYVIGLSVGDHALFCGGSGGIQTVDAYDKTLVRTTEANLSSGRYRYARGANAGKYGLIAGGMKDASNVASEVIETFDENLVLTNNISLGEGKYQMGATNFKGHAMFCGGYTSANQRPGTVEVFDENLTKSLYQMTTAKRYVGATFNTKYAIIAGGNTTNSSIRTSAEAFDESFTHIDIADLSVARREPSCANVGDYAIFAGGYGNNIVSAEAYDSNLTRVDVADLAHGDYSEDETVEVEGYALFWCGWTVGNYSYVTVLAYDELLVQTELTSPADKRFDVGGAIAGDFVIFAGGNGKSTTSTSNINFASVDAYKLS